MRLAECILLAASLLEAQNWPSFRGDHATGVAEGHNLPVAWNVEKGKGIAWKTAVPGLAHSSPIVWGDRLFVTTAVSSDPASEFRHGLFGDVAPAKDQSKHSWRVYALDKKTGKTLWERVAYEGVPKTKRHPKSSFASATPATDGRHVVALFGSEGLYCYDFEGKLLWKRDLGVLDAGWFYDPDYQWGAASSPIIYKNLVIVQADIQKDSFLGAFDVETGKRVWMTLRDELPSWCTPTVYEGPGRPELITQATKFIRAYDPMTGKELWRLAPNSEVTAPTPFAWQGLVIVTSGYRGIQPIYAIRPGGEGDLSLKGEATSGPNIAWSRKHGGPYMSTPVALGDYLYVCATNGVLGCYRVRTGELVYQHRLGETGGAYTASPVAGDGKVYFSSEDGDVNAVKAGPVYELLASDAMGEVIMASPAISDGMIFIRAQHHVFAVK